MEPKILNLEVMHSLDQELGALRQKVDAFLEDSVWRFRDFRAGFETGDWAAMRTTSMEMAAGAGELGAERLARVCRRMETLAASKDADWAVALSLAEEFADVFARTVVTLEAERRQGDTVDWTPEVEAAKATQVIPR
jgi:hypothetical protein